MLAGVLSDVEVILSVSVSQCRPPLHNYDQFPGGEQNKGTSPGPRLVNTRGSQALADSIDIT